MVRELRLVLFPSGLGCDRGASQPWCQWADSTRDSNRKTEIQFSHQKNVLTLHMTSTYLSIYHLSIYLSINNLSNIYLSSSVCM